MRNLMVAFEVIRPWQARRSVPFSEGVRIVRRHFKWCANDSRISELNHQVASAQTLHILPEFLCLREGAKAAPAMAAREDNMR